LNEVKKMSLPRPDLVFVAGPQEGERAVLMSDTAIVGRSRTADVNITEEFVSRRHLEFTNSPDGWIVQTLSDLGMRINGRKFKPGKKVILATGDVVAIGVQTEILFISPPDDPEPAIAQYRKTHAGGNGGGESSAARTESPAPGPDGRDTPQGNLPPPLPHAAQQRQPGGAHGAGEARAPADSHNTGGAGKVADRAGGSSDLNPHARPQAATLAAPGKKTSRGVFGFFDDKDKDAARGNGASQGDSAAADDAEQARLRKRVKYAIIFGSYFLIMIVGGIVLWQCKSGGIFAGPKEPSILPREKIEECLAGRLKRAKDAAGTNAAEALNEALALYDNRNIRVGDLYKCVRQFKLYMAYDDLTYCENSHDDQKYKTARTELTELVSKKYLIACTYEKDHDWRHSKDAFDDLLRVVPEHEKDDPVTEILVRNITEHINFVSGKIRK
jgi:hypothetical protein